MANEQRQKIVTEYLDATVKLDFDRIGSLLSEDFSLVMVPTARDHGMPVPLNGRQTFIDFARALQDRPGMWKVSGFKPEQFLFSEDSAAVRVRLLGKFPSGLDYDNEYVFIFKFAGDKICEMREFTDTAYIAGLFQKSGAPPL